MLDIKVFAKSIERLGEYYPKFELTKEQMEAWYKFFKEYDYDQFMYIIQNYINECSYAPQSPAHLRNGNYKHIGLPPKWMIQQIMNEKKQLPQLETDVNVEELKKMIEGL